MSPRVRLLPFVVSDGPWNMAADEALLSSAIDDTPSLRFYGWNCATLSLGYFLDTSSYPGEEALYLVNYEGSKGQAFVFFVGDRDRRRVFRLENNASFMRKKKGIEFVDPPLGGVWTQEHFESAIERIEQDPKMEVVVKDLRGNFPDVRCESYSDAR